MLLAKRSKNSFQMHTTFSIDKLSKSIHLKAPMLYQTDSHHSSNYIQCPFISLASTLAFEATKFIIVPLTHRHDPPVVDTVIKLHRL